MSLPPLQTWLEQIGLTQCAGRGRNRPRCPAAPDRGASARVRPAARASRQTAAYCQGAGRGTGERAWAGARWQLKAEFKAKYPWAMVPMLELDDGTQIGEAMAICRYFEALHPSPPLLGTDAKERALVEMRELRAHEDGLLGAAEILRNSHPAFADRGLFGYALPVRQVEALVARGRQRLNRFFEMFERQLTQHPFVAGERFSMADITTLCVIDFAQMAKVEIPEACAHVRGWHDRISARPSAKY